MTPTIVYNPIQPAMIGMILDRCADWVTVEWSNGQITNHKENTLRVLDPEVIVTEKELSEPMTTEVHNTPEPSEAMLDAMTGTPSPSPKRGRPAGAKTRPLPEPWHTLAKNHGGAVALAKKLGISYTTFRKHAEKGTMPEKVLQAAEALAIVTAAE